MKRLKGEKGLRM